MLFFLNWKLLFPNLWKFYSSGLKIDDVALVAGIKIGYLIEFLNNLHFLQKNKIFEYNSILRRFHLCFIFGNYESFAISINTCHFFNW